MNPVEMALLGGAFTWFVTTLGATIVLFVRKVNSTALCIMLGASSGIMLSASFWSLLKPALELSEKTPVPCLPILVGFTLGGVFLLLSDKVVAKTEALQHSVNSTKVSRSAILMIFAITVHNIPEGMAFGVAFGGVGAGTTTLASAVALTVGIGIQNFPEGAAISLPLASEGVSKWKSFALGQASALIEPVAAVVGAVLARQVTSVLPYLMAFAAGAMIFVCIDELIPKSQKLGSKGATVGTLVGFLVMTALDILL